MVAVLVGEIGPLRAIFRVTLSPRLTLVLVVKPPRLALSSLVRQAVVPVLHWFSLTTGIGFGQATSACALAGPKKARKSMTPSPSISNALRGRAELARIPSRRRPRIIRFSQGMVDWTG